MLVFNQILELGFAIMVNQQTKLITKINPPFAKPDNQYLVSNLSTHPSIAAVPILKNTE